MSRAGGEHKPTFSLPWCGLMVPHGGWFEVLCQQYDDIKDYQGRKHEKLSRIREVDRKTSPSFTSTISTLQLVVTLCSVMSNSLWPHRLQPTRLLCPWDSPGKNTGVRCHFLFWGIFLTQDSNPVSRIAGRFFTIWGTRKSLLGTDSLIVPSCLVPSARAGMQRENHCY